MSDKEKLVELLAVDSCTAIGIEDCKKCKYAECDDCYLARTADHLIANGVTVQGVEIQRLKEENANLCIAINTLEEINRDLILRIEELKQTAPKGE